MGKYKLDYTSTYYNSRKLFGKSVLAKFDKQLDAAIEYLVNIIGLIEIKDYHPKLLKMLKKKG